MFALVCDPLAATCYPKTPCFYIYIYIYIYIILFSSISSTRIHYNTNTYQNLLIKLINAFEGST